MQNLIKELNRRNVFRMAAAYGVTCWFVLQVADLGLQAIAAPDWVMRAFMLLLLIGLPFVLIFSWVFELTDDGLKREVQVAPDESVTHQTAKKLDYVTIGMLILAIAIVLFRDLLLPAPSDAPGRQAAGARGDTSIAVLAFENMSSDADQGFFADGLSEELLNKLAQNPELKVAGRTSSFAFKGKNRDLREIGEILNVAYILEGSVRKSGEKIRVTAQLIDASEGFHLFSETYDGDLIDVFSVQDSIAERITAALVSELTGGEIVATSTTNPEAYDLYLRARQNIVSRQFERLNAASIMLDRSLELDPQYAPALTQKALVTYLLSDSDGAYGNVPEAVARPEAERLVALALEADNSLAEAHAVRGLLLAEAGQLDESASALEFALSINPSSSEAGTWLSTTIFAEQPERSRKLLEQVVSRDPLFGPAFSNLVNEYYLKGDELDKATALIDRVSRITGESREVRFTRATIALMKGELADAYRHFEFISDEFSTNGPANLWYGFVRIGLGQYDLLSREGAFRHQILGEAMVGDRDSVQAAIDRLSLPSKGFRARAYRNICRALLEVNDHQACIDFLMTQAGTLPQLLVDESIETGWEIEYAGPLAYAYLQNGDMQNFQLLVDAIQRALPKLKAAGSKSWVWDLSALKFASLQGDRDRVVEHLARAVSRGGALDPWIWESWVLEAFKDDPEVVRLRQQVDAHRDAERAKIGLPPYSTILRGLNRSSGEPSCCNG